MINNILACFKPRRRPDDDDPMASGEEGTSSGGASGYGGGGSGGREGMDGSIWFLDNGKHGCGEFSMAVAQANVVLEDQCQLVSGPLGTIVGVYDGHGGHDAARYVCEHLIQNLQDESQEGVTERSIEGAIGRTEEGFSQLVAQIWNNRTSIATCGTCCLIGVIFQQTLFVANLGDSRVVMGSKLSGSHGDYLPLQLSQEHNANSEDVRRQLYDLHPNDPQVVQMKRGAWRVKGVIQVSRCIGDMYMKDAQFNREPIASKFRLTEPMDMPYLSADPEIMTHALTANDSFLIFASDGLWEFLSNAQAVNLVRNNSRASSAKRLVKAALTEAAKRRMMKLSELEKVARNERRCYHDDISVIVLFLNHGAVSRGLVLDPPLSVKGPTTF